MLIQRIKRVPSRMIERQVDASAFFRMRCGEDTSRLKLWTGGWFRVVFAFITFYPSTLRSVWCTGNTFTFFSSQEFYREHITNTDVRTATTVRFLPLPLQIRVSWQSVRGRARRPEWNNCLPTVPGVPEKLSRGSGCCDGRVRCDPSRIIAALHRGTEGTNRARIFPTAAAATPDPERRCRTPAGRWKDWSSTPAAAAAADTPWPRFGFTNQPWKGRTRWMPDGPGDPVGSWVRAWCIYTAAAAAPIATVLADGTPRIQPELFFSRARVWETCAQHFRFGFGLLQEHGKYRSTGHN